jgi:hypothetical protein
VGKGCADRDATSVLVEKRRLAPKVLLARRITFAADGADIAGADAAPLGYLALRLKRARGAKLVISGRAQPGERSTIALERARAAAAHLHAQGVGADRLVIRESRGECASAGVNPCSVDLLLLAPGVNADEVGEGCPEAAPDSPRDGDGTPDE